ncbi:MAG TPA: FtsH protease activity modulator HflK, partial [Candidatus Hydrogenedentes bacterium]|nr:FtsH protease activity modulator HflK [Candidatus Hydrogenedentota bacterium]
MKRIPDRPPEFRLPQLPPEIRIPHIPKGVLAGVLAVLVLLLIVGGGLVYTVAPDEQGVILTFGRYSGIANAGFHFKWPWPIQTVEKPRVAEVKRIEIGFRSRTVGDAMYYQTFLDTPALRQEAQMLTGDENVVDCSMAVQYRIKDAIDYLFNFRAGEAELSLRAVAEAAVRQAVGDHHIDDVLTTGKFEVQNEVQTKMQELADKYGLGVTVLAVQLQDVQPPDEVAPAFRDVATAREERERMINEAQAYEREQIPRAEG